MRAKLKTFIKDVIGVRRDRILAKAPMRESERWAKYKVADDQFEKIKDTFRKGGVNFGKWSGPERDRLDDALSIRGRMSQHLQRSRDAVDMANEATRAARKKAAIAAIAVTGGALAIGGASYLATRKGKELSAKLRLRELALGAGTRIRHIPLTERKNIVERLSKIIGEKPPALEGRVPPRMIRVEDKDFILHYRGANKSRDLKRPYRRFRESIEAIQSFEPPRNMNFKEKQKHFREATSKRDREDWAMANTIGTSTNPQIAKHFRKNHSGSRPGMVGVYATPIEKIPQRIQEGKIGFPGRGHPSRNHWEQEISQQNGGNLVKVRQYRSIDEDNADDVGLPVKTVRGVSESRRIRDLSAKLRLRELARGDYAIPALGKMLKDRSFLEEFLTGKRGPKLGDLRHNFNGGIFTESSKLAGHIPGLLRPIGVGTGISRWGSNARQKGRDAIAKIIRKGRAGGDVYEEIVRS